MADQDARPLTEEERAELEALRAEKARRERAELEALRAERAEDIAAREPSASDAPASVAAEMLAAPSSPAPVSDAPAAASSHAHRVASEAPVVAPVVADDPAARTFGQRMVLSDEEDADGLPAMPPAQKIIIGVCLVAVLGFVIYMLLTNGALG